MRVQLLGPLVVADGERGVIDIRGARSRALLARLALAAGAVVPTAMLVDDLWGDQAPSTNALQSLVSRVRRDLAVGTDEPDLATVVVSHPAGYQLDITRSNIDAACAEDLGAAARVALAGGDFRRAEAAATEGLSLFVGVPLSDIGDPPFAGPAIASLQQVRLGLTEDGADARLGAGRIPDLAELEQQARSHPLRERLQGLLIRSLYAAGRQADALAAYDRTRRQLVDELGVDPSPALEQIHLAVLRQDPEMLPPTTPYPPVALITPTGDSDLPVGHGNLRTALTSFVGREAEVEQVLAALNASRLVTVVGPGGAGKTRMSLETGHRLAEELPGGVWLVELAPVHEPLDLPQAVLSALGLRERRLLDRPGEMRASAVDEPGDAMDRLIESLAGAQLLIVLDNCEHLISSVAELADRVLSNCPGVRLLTTSREPLGITGETLCPLSPLGLPPVGATPETAVDYAAVQLLVDRATAVQPTFAITDETVGPVVSICRRLDGLPLAIELAAARLRAMSAEQVASRLDDRFRLLTGGSRTALPRHRTLLAVVEWSWELLEKPERLLLQRLAVFSAPVRLELIESICSDHETLPQADVLDVLATLVDKSLVDAVGAGDVRYRLLETVRAFGADRLAESGEAAEVRNRHAAHLLELVERAEPQLRGPDQLAWLARLDALREDILGALRWSIDSGAADHAIRFVAYVGWYLHLRGMTSEFAHWPHEALALADDGLADCGPVDAAALAITHAYLAMGAAGDGDLPAGMAALQRAIELGRAVVDTSDHPIVSLLEPASFLFLREFERGMSSIDEVVQHHPDQWTRGVALILQGHAMENAGQMSEVAACYEKAYRIFTGVGERWGQAIALSSLAEIQQGQGHYPEAMAGFERALAYLREAGTSDDVTMTLTRLARIRLITGDRTGAVVALTEARENADRFNQPAQSALVEVGYANLALVDGDLAEAERLLRDMPRLVSAGVAGPPQVRAMVAALLGEVLTKSGQLPEARSQLIEALAFAVSSRDVPVIADVMAQWAMLALAEAAGSIAAAILGWSVAVRTSPIPEHGERAELVADIKAAIGRDAFTAAYDAGAALSRDEAIDALIAWTGQTREQLDALVTPGSIARITWSAPAR